jgi:acetyltransferase-like isoleucine patch superfamily enzyme
MIRGNFTAEEGVIVPDDLDTGYNVVLRKDVMVGRNVKIWSGTVIDPGAVIGDNVRIHCNCYISQGCVIEDDVFIGPGTVLLNDKYPVRTDSECWEPVRVCKGAIIGGGCTILPGVTIGSYAFIGAGAVVTKDVPGQQVWWGHPAKDQEWWEIFGGVDLRGRPGTYNSGPLYRIDKFWYDEEGWGT